MTNDNIVIDLFESCIHCLSELIDTQYGGWVCGIIVLIGVVRLIKGMQSI